MKDKFLQFLGIIKKSGNLVEGYNKCEEIIDKRKLFLLIISIDCSNNTKERFVKLCNNNNVPYIEAYTKEELGAPIGRDEINLVGVLSKNMRDKLLDLLKEQNTI